MSVIAFDGKTVCSDRQAAYGNLMLPATKLIRHENAIIVFVGNADDGVLLVEWYKNRDKKNFPSFKEFRTVLIVVIDGKCEFYETNHIPFPVETDFIAFGSGRDFAIAAMEMGANARRSVEIACKYDINCGLGIDEMECF